MKTITRIIQYKGTEEALADLETTLQHGISRLPNNVIMNARTINELDGIHNVEHIPMIFEDVGEQRPDYHRGTFE